LKCHGLWDNQKPDGTFVASGFLKRMCGSFKLSMRKKARNLLCFGAFVIHTRRMNMKMFLARSLAKMTALASKDLFHFALENSVEKGHRTLSKKNTNTMRGRLSLLREKTICILPAEYGTSLSLSD